MFYMGSLLLVSWLGSFGGIGLLEFPYDLICILPLSILTLSLSQKVLTKAERAFADFEERELVGDLV